jgi:cob(I)alamin adenosyltransferase
MKIYTKTGDTGSTALFGGKRVSKESLRIDAYGTVDELNALLGIVGTSTAHGGLRDAVYRVQRELFILGADLATPLDTPRVSIPRVDDAHVEWMEELMDDLETRLPELRNFILPGGSVAAAHLHHCRTVCRRAERAIVRLAGYESINETDIVYINRLSDLLFVLAREANRLDGHEDVPWKSD